MSAVQRSLFPGINVLDCMGVALELMTRWRSRTPQSMSPVPERRESILLTCLLISAGQKL